METMRQYGLLHIDASGNVNPRKDASRAEGAYTLVKFAQGAGLGEEPVITQKPSVAPVDKANYGDEAYNKAVSVHDELWASGKITSSMSQKEKARVYYDWLLQHCVYDSAGLANETKQLEDAMASHDLSSIFDSFFGSSSEQSPHTAYSALIKGKAVCDGYTSAYNLFLALEGIVCDVESGPDHMWTSATLDGVLYHIDATYGDTTGQPNKYFGMTEADAWARFGYASEADYVQSIMEAAGH